MIDILNGFNIPSFDELKLAVNDMKQMEHLDSDDYTSRINVVMKHNQLMEKKLKERKQVKYKNIILYINKTRRKIYIDTLKAVDDYYKDMSC